MRPGVAASLSDTSRIYRVGWRLTPERPAADMFELNLETVRREQAGGNEPGHELGLSATTRW